MELVIYTFTTKVVGYGLNITRNQMKPKAPKKKDTKPNCKTGEVREKLRPIYITKQWIDNDGNWMIELSYQKY